MTELIIDWDFPRLSCLEISREGERILGMVEHAFVAPEELSDFRRARELGEWLARELSLKQISSNEWTIILPRDRMTLRRLELPPVPDTELPTMVQFQMASQLAASAEQMVVDYLPTQSTRSGESFLHVIGTSVAGDMLAQIKVVAALCQATVKHVFPATTLLSSVATLVNKAKSSSRNGVSILIWANAHRIESLLLHEGDLVLANSRRRNSQEPIHTAELAGDARRLIMLNPGSTLEETPDIFVWTNLPTVVLELQKELDADVIRVEPEVIAISLLKQEDQNRTISELTMTGQLSTVAASRSGAHPFPQIDFLSPRQPPVKKDHRLLYGLVSGLLVLLIAGVGMWMWNARLAELNDEIASLETAISESNMFLKARSEVGEAAGKINEHLNQQVEMTKLFEELLTTLPGTDRLYLSTYSVIPLSGQYRGRVTGSGYAKRRVDVEGFNEQLTSRGLRVKPTPIDEESKDDPAYPVKFSLEFDIPAAEPALKKPSVKNPVQTTFDQKIGPQRQTG